MRAALAKQLMLMLGRHGHRIFLVSESPNARESQIRRWLDDHVFELKLIKNLTIVIFLLTFTVKMIILPLGNTAQTVLFLDHKLTIVSIYGIYRNYCVIKSFIL